MGLGVGFGLNFITGLLGPTTKHMAQASVGPTLAWVTIMFRSAVVACPSSSASTLSSSSSCCSRFFFLYVLCNQVKKSPYSSRERERLSDLVVRIQSILLVIDEDRSQRLRP